MKCLVTGAAGFIGSSLVDRLLKLGHQVVGIDSFVDYYPRAIKERNIATALQHQSFQFLELDLETAELVPVLDGVNWVFHLAAQAGVRASWGKDFDIYTGKNILSTQRLLEAAKDSLVLPNLKKLVYSSSSSVYGDAEAFPTSESILPKPVSPYGVSKLAAEHLTLLYDKAFGVPTVSLRYFTVYGPRQRPDMAFNIFSRAALLKKPIRIFGDGEQSRDFTYVDDAVQANILAASCDAVGLVCNIGGGSRVTVNDVLKRLEAIVGKSLNVVYQSRQLGDARHTSADVSRARELLGYQPTVDLDSGLKAEVAWTEQQLAAEK